MGSRLKTKSKIGLEERGNNNVVWLGEQGLGYTLVRTEPAKWAIVGAEEAVQSCILDALALDALKVEWLILKNSADAFKILKEHFYG